MKFSSLPNRRTALAYALSPVLLSACGGGGSSEPPAILQQPASATVKAGGTATFSVGVKDASGVAYQWMRNEVAIPGATQATLAYSPVSLLEDGAVFWAVVSNAGGTVKSNPATLTATSPALTVLAGVQWTPDNRPAAYVDATGSDARFDRKGPIALDDGGNIYVASFYSIRKLTPQGAVSTFAGSRTNDSVDGNGANARFDLVGDLLFDRSRSVLLVTETVANTTRVREVTLAGDVSTVRSFPGTYNTHMLAQDGSVHGTAGHVRLAFQGDLVQSAVYRLPPAGPAQLLAGDPDISEFKDGASGQARFREILALAADGKGNVYVADDHAIRRIGADGGVTTLAGASTSTGAQLDGVGATASFGLILGLHVESSGNLLVADGNLVRRMTPDGRVTTIARSSAQGNAPALRLASDRTGMLYAAGLMWVGRFEPLGD